MTRFADPEGEALSVFHWRDFSLAQDTAERRSAARARVPRTTNRPVLC